MRQVLTISRPVLQSSLKVQLCFLCAFSQAAYMRMLFDLDSLEQIREGSSPVFLELAEAVVDDSESFLGDVIPDIGKELEVIDATLMGEAILDDSDFLSAEEDA